MCDVCSPDGTMSACQYCSRLICFDEQGADDVIARAAVTPGGDLACSRCARQIATEEESACEEEGVGPWDYDGGEDES